TGSASFDFYGGNREGENLYANCVLALEAATGKLRWHFQTIHHDIWDRDLPAPPNLITLNINGKKVDAVAQITKSGFVFVLDRETGKPLYPVEERPVPASEVPGEHAWPTQPVPVDLPAFARNTLTEADINPYSADRDSMLELFRSYKKGQQFIPASEQGTLIFPGFDGGGEWGGAAWDPATGVMYINSNEMAWVLKLVANPEAKDQRLASYGERIYQMSCASCHGSDRKGTAFMGQAPALLGIKGRVAPELAEQKIRKGWGVMPAFAYFKDEEVKAVLAYLYDSPEMASPEFAKTLPEALPYTFTGYKKFLDKQGLPGISPPWGQLTALDIPNKKILWQIPFGEYPALKAKGIPPTGAENYGGPAVTAGGLLFIAAARDGKFRAYEKATGKLLWETQLPAAGYATPAVYEVNGKQFVVVACGGGKLGTPSGDSWIAFGL
ncbi:MAG: pyrroloquinoline quinone-dependent dehydrogenase, partial [Bacteroidetes bacterium]